MKERRRTETTEAEMTESESEPPQRGTVEIENITKSLHSSTR